MLSALHNAPHSLFPPPAFPPFFLISRGDPGATSLPLQAKDDTTSRFIRSYKGLCILRMDCFTPQQTIELVSRLGCKKAHMRLDKLFWNSFMAGPLLGFG